ncbi:OmpW family protein [Lichenicola cladoniae]|uniref:OmpW family protein n=1 Tax=Lichenicola cladoniae TaxID=1484109 RepID=A0A6M8HH62_9PROT|nr:OmpW family outer membrane protein [Lichenicola cladoniae]NPD68568.1 OmpW family protein [Acetobacteraceae bacterium]QKE88952.1 OmpW family protein [Lichenicola cladoniae]
MSCRSVLLSMALLSAVITGLSSLVHAADLNDPAPIGKHAGTFMVRLRAIGVLPENLSSATSLGGSVHASNQVAPEVDLSYFLTDHLALELIAASTRHEVSASATVLGHVDVGSTYVLPPTLTLQYHFMPHGRFSPYVGAGLTVAWFYDTSPSRPTVAKVGFETTVGPTVQIGADYNLTGHWFLNVDAKQMFLNTRARINGGAIRARTSLDPTVVGVGIGYRF